MLALSLVAAVGCAGPDPDQVGGASANTATVDTRPDQQRVRADRVDAIAATVPASIRRRGTLVMATTGNGNPPLSFRADDDRTIIGMEPDMAQLVADVLGLRLEIRPTSWENLFVAVESGQYDVGFSNITVTEDRKDSYDLATYRVDTISFEASNTGRVASIAKPADISTLTIGVSAGTNQEQMLLDWNKQNEAAGVPPATIAYYQNVGDYYLALDSGRLDAYLGPNPGVAYHVATGGRTKVVGSVSGSGTSQRADIAALTKKNNGLIVPIQQAINTVIANGRYAQVLDRWKLRTEGLPQSQVNPPGLPRKPVS